MTFWMASFGLDKSLHCFYVLFQLLTVFGYRSKIMNTVLVNIKTSNQRVDLDSVWPCFSTGRILFLMNGQFVGVDDFGLSAAVDELQRPVPLALSFTHHRPRWSFASPLRWPWTHTPSSSSSSLFSITSHFRINDIDDWLVNFAPVEGFGVECDVGRVSGLGAADGDLSSELHPRPRWGWIERTHSENVNTYSSPWSRRYKHAWRAQRFVCMFHQHRWSIRFTSHQESNGKNNFTLVNTFTFTQHLSPLNWIET